MRRIIGDVFRGVRRRRGVRALLLLSGIVRLPARKGDDRISLDDIAAAVRMLGHGIVDLRDIVRRRRQIGRGNSPRRRNMGGVRVRDIFEILQRPGGLCRRRTEGIVRQRIGRPVACTGDDIIGNVLCLGDMRGEVVPIRVACEMPRRSALQVKGDLPVVARDKARRWRRCDRCRQIGTRGEGIAVIAVVDLRRIGDRSIRLAHLKARWIDAAARDRSCAVLRIDNLIVVVRQCSCKPRILHRTAARIDVRGKRCPRTAAIAAGHARHIEVRRGDPVRRDDSAAGTVVQRSEFLVRIGIRAVIDLRHGGKCHREAARGDDARIAPRDCRAV